MTFGKSDRGGAYRRRFFHATLILAILVCAIVLLTACDGGDKTAVNADDVKVIYCLNNGEDDIIQQLNAAPPVPAREGFVFEGWCLRENGGPVVDVENIADLLGEIRGSVEDGKIRVYAKWREADTLEGVCIKDAEIVYDGKPHGLAVSGLPDGATVEFSQNNIVDAGEYVINAVVRADGYKPLELQGKLTVLKAYPDMSDVILRDESFVWDGEEKYLRIEGELPQGVTVTYKNNGKRDVGVYTVAAHFEVGNNYLPADDLIATLTISKPNHTVRFVDDGEAREFCVPHGKGLVEIPVPVSKRGYSAQWDTSADALAAVNEDIVVTAVYTPIDYSIVYNVYGGDMDKSARDRYTVNDGFDLPVASKEYYTFDGWIDQDGERLEEIKPNTVGDKVLHAVWRPIEYKVLFDARGGINDSSNADDGDVYTYTVESEDLTLKPARRRGYAFKGWQEEGGGEIARVDASEPRNICVYAEWEIIVYGIEYDANGGGFAEAVKSEYTIEDGDILLPLPVRKGYLFCGWFERGCGKPVETIVADACRDFALRASWGIEEYSVKYVLYDGENDGRNKTFYTVDTESFMLYSPSKEGFIFEGWYDNAQFEGDKITCISTSDCTDFTLYAKWRGADEPSQSSPFAFENRDGKNIIVGYDYSFGKDIVIPDCADGIEEGVLIGADSVKIDARWTHIESNVFAGCANLKKLVLPITLEALPHGLLKDCTTLRSLTLPFAGDRDPECSGKVYSVAVLFGTEERADCYAVSSCARVCEGESVNFVFDDKTPRYVPFSLKEITISDGDISGYAFDGWKGLETVRACGGKKMEQFALRDCASLKYVFLCDGFEDIASTAFRGCANISAISVPADLDIEIVTAALRRAGGNSVNAEIMRNEQIIAL